MAVAIRMPKLGMTMEEGTVVEWRVEVGGSMTKGVPALVIESEKTEAEIEAPVSGVVRHFYVPAGDTVPCGALLAAVTGTADEPFDAEAFRAQHEEPAPASPTPRLARPARPVVMGAARRPARKPVAPAARALARKLGLDPEQVAGSGPSGRVTREDVQAHAAARAALVTVAEGVGLEVLASGKGESVLLLPGLGTDASAFSPQLPVLAERFRVLAVNPRGVGHSDAPEAVLYPVAQTAADAAAAFEGSAHVVGASLGAAAALELALAHPERVRTLTLVTPFVDAGPRLLAVADAWCRLSAEATAESLAAALLPWFFSPALLGDERARGRTLRGLTQTLSRVSAPGLARAVAGLRAWSGTRGGDLARVTAPTLVVAAGGDLLTSDAEAVAAAIPGARVARVAGAGHAVALEAPDAVSRVLLEHLA